MAKPKIRHLAIMARDPEKVAQFYADVFDMKVIHVGNEGGGTAKFLSDGYLTLAILPHKLKGSAPVGLNHFGFHVENRGEIMDRIVAKGLEEPQERPAERPYAEYRGCDIEGNWFDISQHGFEEVETGFDRAAKSDKAKTKVPA
jgi:catechol 2,3-dioxygenase-like lactoylglutathione lyase family enzyme